MPSEDPVTLCRQRAARRAGCASLTIVLIVTGCLQFWFARCLFLTCAPPRDFAAVDLAIPMSYFPENSESTGLNAMHHLDEGVEGADMDVFWSGPGAGRARYVIDRYGTAIEAGWAFDGLGHSIVSDPLHPCPALKELTIHADDVSVQCGDPGFGGYNAEMTARYEEYVVFLLVHPSEQMTYPEIAEVMTFVDRQMRYRLKWKPQQGEPQFHVPEPPALEFPNGPCLQFPHQSKYTPCYYILSVSRAEPKPSDPRR